MNIKDYIPIIGGYLGAAVGVCGGVALATISWRMLEEGNLEKAVATFVGGACCFFIGKSIDYNTSRCYARELEKEFQLKEGSLV